MSKFFKLSLILISFSFSSLTFAYDFKGYVLGLELGEFKARGVHPDIHKLYDKYSYELICSDGVNEISDYSDLKFYLNQLPADSAVLCGFYEINRLTYGYLRTLADLEINLDGNSALLTPIFTFVKDKESFFLARIDVEFSSEKFPTVSKAFVKKYGASHKRITNQLQNKFGAKFSNEEFIWQDKFSKIYVEKYSDNSSLKTGKVTLIHTRFNDVFLRLLKVKQKQQEKGL